MEFTSRKARLLSAAAALATAVSCATVPYTDRKQVMLVPQGQLSSMGTQAFVSMLQQVPTSQDPEVVGYVACVTKPIIDTFRERHEGPEQWKLAVLKDPNPNAFVIPGGNIGVNVGILKVAKTDEQLAAVMGHELGHELAHHAGERMSQQLLAQGGLAIAQGFVLKDAPPGQQRALMAALGLGAQVGVMLPFSRKHESEADVIGLQLMAGSGYDPRQSVELWRNMAEATRGQQPPQFLSTHPSPESRMKNLSKNMPSAMAAYEREEATPDDRQMAGTVPGQGEAKARGECKRPSDERIEASLR